MYSLTGCLRSVRSVKAAKRKLTNRKLINIDGGELSTRVCMCVYVYLCVCDKPQTHMPPAAATMHECVGVCM